MEITKQVYCKKCYENRKCTKNTGFKHKDQGSSALGAAGSSSGAVAAKNLKVLCAVDGCTTDVSYKTAWVGLFL